MASFSSLPDWEGDEELLCSRALISRSFEVLIYVSAIFKRTTGLEELLYEDR